MDLTMMKSRNKHGGNDRFPEVDAVVVRTEISPQVFLYTTRTNRPLAFRYEVESATHQCVQVTIKFDGSDNFCAQLSNGKIISETSFTSFARPFCRSPVGQLKVVDHTQPARLKFGYEFVMLDLNAQETNELVALVDENETNITRYLIQAHTKNYSTLLSQRQVQFIDTTFSPMFDSIYQTNPLLMSNESPSLISYPVTWRRPTEFMHWDRPQLFPLILRTCDIRQGCLGDGWFLSSLAILAECPHLLTQLFPQNNETISASGQYHIRLCEAGHWETITVDDFIPCYPEGGPLYAKGHGNELWVMLLEKAYAKLCGSYAALKAGWAFEAMIDLTGAPYWTVRFDDSETKKMVEDGSLWSLMLQNDDLGYIQSASTPGEDVLTVGGDRKSKDNETGLVAGHAYALIAVKEVKSKGLKLVQLRNPWGEGGMEWNGDWSDSSPLWTAEIQRELGITDLDTNDGSFWMCFSDFIKYFFSVNACLIRHVDMGTSKWFESRKKMSFSMSPEGEVRAPSYLLTLTEASDKVYFSMHQQDIRHVTAKPYIDFGVTVLQLNASTGKYTLVTSSGNSADRQNQTKEMSLPAGQYLVIPTSTGCRLSWQYEKHTERCIRETCDCIGTIDAKKHGNPYVTVTNYDDGHENFIPSIVMVLTEIFVRFDYDEDGVLNRQELSQFLQLTEGWNSDVMVPDDAFEWFLTTFANTATLGDTNECMGLSLSGFIASQLYAYVEGGRNAGALFRELGM